MSIPAKFRKKPVVIDALQWTGTNLRAVVDFVGGGHGVGSRLEVGGLVVFSLEGKHSATVGDWIIRGVKGDHYVCKPDIFALTYDRED